MPFLESNEQYLEFAKVNKDKFIEVIIKGKIPDDEKDANFMAERLGADKTEVAIS